jgi:hypothetical protein
VLTAGANGMTALGRNGQRQRLGAWGWPNEMGFEKAKVAVARKLAVMERGNEYPSGYLGIDGPKDYRLEPERRG